MRVSARIYFCRSSSSITVRFKPCHGRCARPENAGAPVATRGFQRHPNDRSFLLRHGQRESKNSCHHPVAAQQSSMPPLILGGEYPITCNSVNLRSAFRQTRALPSAWDKGVFKLTGYKKGPKRSLFSQGLYPEGRGTPPKISLQPSALSFQLLADSRSLTANSSR
jgi:hypothetical protein